MNAIWENQGKYRVFVLIYDVVPNSYAASVARCIFCLHSPYMRSSAFTASAAAVARVSTCSF